MHVLLGFVNLFGAEDVSGHQNQRPSAKAIAGVMKARTMNVSTSGPIPIAVPNCPITRRSLAIIDAMWPRISGNIRPAAVTTRRKAPMPQMMPVLRQIK